MDTKNSHEEKVEHASDIIGNWGPAQKRMFWYIFIIYFVSAFQNRAIVFYAPRIDYWCKRPPGFENATAQTCASYDDPMTKCTEWEYDLSFYYSTMIDQFDLVCDRAWLVSASQSCYQLGYLISSISVGFISDRFGRLVALKMCILLAIFAGFGQTFAPNIYVFIIIRTIGGIAAYGRYLSGYLLVMEYVGPLQRAKIGSYMEFSWGISAMIQPGVYYLVRHFQHMQLIATVYEVLASLCLFKMSESPRWLLTNGHYEKAHQIILTAATEKRKLTTEQIESKLVQLKSFVDSEIDSRRNEKKQSLLDVYRDPSLLKHCLLLYCTWCSMTFITYGLSLNIGDLGGNLFINTFAIAVGSLTAKAVLVYIVDRFTRRRLLFLAYMGAAGSFVVMAFLTSAPHVYMTIFAFIGSMAIAIIAILNYIFAAEIFPTTVRQITMGSCGFVARFGSMSAPFMKEVTEATHLAFTLSIFGACSAIAGGLVYFLPETQGKEIPDTIKRTRKGSESHAC